MAVEPLAINGTVLTAEELAELAEITGVEPPYDEEDIAALSATLDRINRENHPLSDLIAAFTALTLAAILLRGLDAIGFIPVQQQYYRGRRRITEGEIARRIARYQARSEGLVNRWTDDLINGRISLTEWQRRVSDRVIRDHINMVQLGAGGRRNISARHLQNLNNRLRRGMGRGGLGTPELEALERFARQIKNGELSEAQIRNRARRYARNTRASYEESRHTSLTQQGGWLAMRQLDPAAQHCRECPDYETRGQFLPASEVVPVGVACSCRANCRCTVVYRKVNLSDGLPIG